LTKTNHTGILEIHVLGAGIGESIILKLPGPKWGVVDCYSESLSDTAKNHTLNFLRSRGARELEFLCLTHPHEDHYRGMSQLLQNLNVRQFWRFGGMSGKQFRSLVHYFTIDASRADARREIDNADEFYKIFRLVKEKGIGEKLVGFRQQLFPEKLDIKAHLQIWSLAPSGGQLSRYEDQLAKCFDSDGTIRDKIPYARHNTVSIALLIQYGKTSVLLGGDVERRGWADAIKEVPSERFSVSAVKVSHHGSDNGYTDNLWQLFAGGGKPIAVITPYRRFGLPKPEALDLIGDHSTSVITTCLPAMAEQVLTSGVISDAVLRSRLALRQRLNAFVEPSTDECGRCSLFFDDSGKCVGREIDPPAEEISS
jgi:beta-lactamase superfamily II metal-dependent hydrolase